MVNQIILIGNLGQDPELKQTQSGKSVCSFSVATTETWRDKLSQEKQSKTEWHTVVVWGKQAEMCNQYLAKGKMVYVSGKSVTESWDDKDGNKRYTTKVQATEVKFLSGNKDTNNALKDATDSVQKSFGDVKVSTNTNFASDDIPF